MERAVPYILVGLLALALFVVLAFVAVRGLGELGSGAGAEGLGHEEYDEAWAGESTDPAFVYVEPLEEYASAPQPAWAILPRTAVELSVVPSEVPAARIRGALAIGDELTRHSLLAALRSLRDDAAPPESIAALYGPLVAGHPTATHCRWLRDVLANEESLPIRESFYEALASCNDARTITLFLHSADVPEAAAASFRDRHGWLFAEPRSDVEALVDSPAVDLLALLAAPIDGERERERLARALVRCATADPATSAHGEWRSAECLDALHTTSPAMALPAARAIDARGAELPYLRAMARQIAEELTGDQLVHRLRDRGLLRDADQPHPDAPAGVAARDVLARHGRAVCFDTGSDTPVGHDGLLIRLAWLARPDLDDVSFAETPPYAGDYGYRLHAYASEYVHTVDARNHGGRYDTYAVLGLLNALLRDRYVDTRLAWLHTPGVDVECVVAGSRQGLLDAEREGLIALEDPVD